MIKSNMRNRLIIALDVSAREKAISLVKELNSRVAMFKVGPVLFTRYGPDIIREIQDYGGKVFLDFKYYDIPHTVAATVRAVAKLGISMFTVHISGGREMLRAAVDSLREAPGGEPRPRVIGVTILTSVASVSDSEIVQMANTAQQAGLDGVVCSSWEAGNIRLCAGEGFLIVTPGIRPPGTGSGDQKRVATPKTAVANGADYIVVGRPVIEDPRPGVVVEQILSDISSR